MSNGLLQQTSWRKWTIISGCWIGCTLFWTSQGYLVQGRFAEKIAWLNTLITSFMWACAWNAVTPFILKLSKRFPLQRRRVLRTIGVHAVAASGLFLIVQAMYVVAIRVIFGSPSDFSSSVQLYIRLVITEFHAGLLIYALIVGIDQAIGYYRRYREQELQALNLEARLVQAQLDALRMQLHPHFLFNTLNSISVLMRRDTDAADRMLLQLSNLLRVTLARNAAHEIKLKQELEILERYLEIEQIRFQDRLTVRMHIDDTLLEALVPQLFFQPLVENAIRHGIADRELGGIIDIRAERQNGLVCLEVRDNGPGLNLAQDNLIEGVGLSNTRSRLDRLYGADSRFEVANAEEGGLIVAAAFPFHTEILIEDKARR